MYDKLAAAVRWASVLGCLGTLSGCTHRTILRFDDHPVHPVTVLQSLHTKNYVVYGSSEHQFFMCRDTPSQLVCKRACGGSTGIDCPTDAMNALVTTTNVR